VCAGIDTHVQQAVGMTMSAGLHVSQNKFDANKKHGCFPRTYIHTCTKQACTCTREEAWRRRAPSSVNGCAKIVCVRGDDSKEHLAVVIRVLRRRLTAHSASQSLDRLRALALSVTRRMRVILVGQRTLVHMPMSTGAVWKCVCA
jgi:hypothetical protein